MMTWRARTAPHSREASLGYLYAVQRMLVMLGAVGARLVTSGLALAQDPVGTTPAARGQRSPAGLGTGNGAGVGSVAASPR